MLKFPKYICHFCCLATKSMIGSENWTKITLIHRTTEQPRLETPADLEIVRCSKLQWVAQTCIQSPSKNMTPWIFICSTLPLAVDWSLHRKAPRLCHSLRARKALAVFPVSHSWPPGRQQKSLNNRRSQKMGASSSQLQGIAH